MLRNKNTPLPLHHGAQGGGAVNPQSVNAALEKGLSMVGLATTKTGSGEKEKAYVVKQNSVLKGVLCLVLIGVCGLIILFSTVLELKVARRGLIISEAHHRKEEHHDHEDLLRTSLELQEALEATIEETSLVDEFRAYFDKSIGTLDNRIDRLFSEAGVGSEVADKAKQLQRDFERDLDIRLNKILNRFHKRAMEARTKVVAIAKAMGRTIDIDATNMKKYGERLEQLGVDENYAEKLEEQYDEQNQDEFQPPENEELTEEERNRTPEELRERREREAQEQAEESEREIEGQLNTFFKKLQGLTLPTIPPEKITVIETGLNELLATLQDETKETDLDMVEKKMEELIMTQAPGSLNEKFDPNKHDSLIDFYVGFVERAKLQPHKQTLIDLYNGWKSPGSQLTAMNVLAAIENVAVKEQLMKIFDLLEGNDIDPRTETKDEQEANPNR